MTNPINPIQSNPIQSNPIQSNPKNAPNSSEEGSDAQTEPHLLCPTLPSPLHCPTAPHPCLKTLLDKTLRGKFNPRQNLVGGGKCNFCQNLVGCKHSPRQNLGGCRRNPYSPLRHAASALRLRGGPNAACDGSVALKLGGGARSQVELGDAVSGLLAHVFGLPPGQMAWRRPSAESVLQTALERSAAPCRRPSSPRRGRALPHRAASRARLGYSARA